MKKTVLPLLILITFLVLAPAFAHSGVPTAATIAGEQHLAHVETEYDMGMYGPIAAAMGPDGEDVYVVTYMEDSLVVFRRDTATGALTYLEKHLNGVNAHGLNGAHDVVPSPDGKNVYAIGYFDDALVTFDRNLASGALLYQDRIVDGGSIDGLRSPNGMAINPLGTVVYVASLGEDALSVFIRDTTTGELSFSQVFFDGEGVEGLDHATSVAVSPDNKNVYVVGNGDNAVAIFSWDEGSGILTYRGFVMDSVGIVEGLFGPNRITLDPTGAHLYVACRGDTVVVFNRDSSSGDLTFVEYHQDGVGSVDGLRDAEWLSVSPDGGHVYVAGSSDNAIAIFSREGISGVLHYEGMVQSNVDGVPGLASINSVIVSPGSGDHVYAISPSVGSIVAFDRDTSSGDLTFQKMLRNARGLDGAVGVALSGDNRHVYVAGNNANAVTVFSKDYSTGELTFVQEIEDSLGTLFMKEARDVAVSPGGAHVYVAGYGDDAIVIFDRDGETGQLTRIGEVVDGVDGLVMDGPQAITISPAGDKLYAATRAGNAIITFGRNPATGMLGMMSTATDGPGTINSLGGAYAVAVSPDGSSWYVAAIDDDAVSVFSSLGGGLDYKGAVVDGVDEVDGLDGANDVIVSDDGRYVYVASRDDDAVAHFSRSLSDGMLTYQGMVKNDVDGVHGLNGPRALTISPDDVYLYVASQHSDAVTTFLRDAATGELSFVEARYYWEPGLRSLDIANGIALSRNGKHIYVTGYSNDALVVLRTEFPIFLPYLSR